MLKLIVVSVEGVHKYVKEPVPPAADTEIEPSALPKHETIVVVNEIRISGGEVIKTVEVLEQPPASVTVTVYIPGPSPVATESVPPEGDQE